VALCPNLSDGFRWNDYSYLYIMSSCIHFYYRQENPKPYDWPPATFSGRIFFPISPLFGELNDRKSLVLDVTGALQFPGVDFPGGLAIPDDLGLGTGAAVKNSLDLPV
jgi:hypothetical protein